VVASIRAYGWRQPIVVDADGVIVAGHTRYLAAVELGVEKVPVHEAKDMTPEQAKAYRLADNRTAEIAEWDLESLGLELGELDGMGVDLSPIGWDAGDLSELMGSAAAGEILGGGDVVPDGKDRSGSSPWDRVGSRDSSRVVCVIGDVESSMSAEAHEKMLACARARAEAAGTTVIDEVSAWLEGSA